MQNPVLLWRKVLLQRLESAALTQVSLLPVSSRKLIFCGGVPTENSA